MSPPCPPGGPAEPGLAYGAPPTPGSWGDEAQQAAALGDPQVLFTPPSSQRAGTCPPSWAASCHSAGTRPAQLRDPTGGPEASWDALTSRPPCAGSSGTRRSGRWCPSGRTCPPGRPGAAAQPRALQGRRDLRPRGAQSPAGGGGAGRGLTLAEEGVLRQAPQRRLHHLQVPAAQAVHERGQEVGRDAAKATRSVGTSPRARAQAGGAGRGGGAHLGLFCMERRARPKARLRQDSSAELMSRCRLVWAGAGRGVTRRPCCAGDPSPQPPPRAPSRMALRPQGLQVGGTQPQPGAEGWPVLDCTQAGGRVQVCCPHRTASQPRVPLGCHPGFPEDTACALGTPLRRPTSPAAGSPLPAPHREETQDLGSPSGHLVDVTQHLQQI